MDDLAAPKFKGATDCARKMLAGEGIGAFFKGFTPCFLRAAPVNAGGFLMFEMAMKLMGSNAHLPDDA
jgi:solute carrier family 25 carnitine/acylcarnitine transporter 20/29